MKVSLLIALLLTQDPDAEVYCEQTRDEGPEKISALNKSGEGYVILVGKPFE